MSRSVLVVELSSGGPAGFAKTALGVMVLMVGGAGGEIVVRGCIKSTDATKPVRPAFHTAIAGHMLPHVGYETAHVTTTRSTQLAFRFVVCTFTVAESQKRAMSESLFQ